VIFKVFNTILKPLIDVAGFEAILAHENLERFLPHER